MARRLLLPLCSHESRARRQEQPGAGRSTGIGRPLIQKGPWHSQGERYRIWISGCSRSRRGLVVSPRVEAPVTAKRPAIYARACLLCLPDVWGGVGACVQVSRRSVNGAGRCSSAEASLARRVERESSDAARLRDYAAAAPCYGSSGSLGPGSSPPKFLFFIVKKWREDGGKRDTNRGSFGCCGHR